MSRDGAVEGGSSPKGRVLLCYGSISLSSLSPPLPKARFQKTIAGLGCDSQTLCTIVCAKHWERQIISLSRSLNMGQFKPKMSCWLTRSPTLKASTAVEEKYGCYSGSGVLRSSISYEYPSERLQGWRRTMPSP